MYAFFEADVTIHETADGRRAHIFKCAARHCKGRGLRPREVNRWLDKKDRSSTGSLKDHARSCWGEELVKEAGESGSNIAETRKVLRGATLEQGKLTAVFERTGKGKITYSHIPHTREETR